jgi:hypothetical protein
VRVTQGSPTPVIGPQPVESLTKAMEIIYGSMG